MGTGVEKLTCCHPTADSAVNVAVARRVPVLVQRLPMCVPTLLENLKKRTPVMYPPTSERKRTPSSTALVSVSCTPGVDVALVHSVHGQGSGPDAAAVVNDQLKFDAIALPARSFTPVVIVAV